MARSAAALRMVAPQAAPATPAQTPEAARIAGFVRGFSIGASAPTAGEIDAIRAVLPIRTAVYLAAMPGRPLQEQVAAATRLRRAGLEPVPHIAARSHASAAALDETLARFSGEAAVRRVLVVAGDLERSAGPFGSALDVIESGLLPRHGIAGAGIAGHPQGHPRVAQTMLDRALARKIEAAAQTGLDLHIVTQFGFDAGATAEWLLRLRATGIDLPVRLGMAGPASLSRLLRAARRCGVRASAQGLARQAGLVKHLLGASAPDGLIRPLATSHAAGALGEVTPHFYSFGGAAATARWATAVAMGRLVLDRAGGFGVEAP